MKKDSSSVRIKNMQTLAEDRGKLTSVMFEQRRRDGSWQQRKREIYDHGNSAVVLPYDVSRNTILLNYGSRSICRTAWTAR